MKTIEARTNHQSTCENGMKIRRIDDKGIPLAYAKCIDSAKCGSGELKNFVRFTVLLNAPIDIFTDPLANCKEIQLRITIEIEVETN